MRLKSYSGEKKEILILKKLIELSETDVSEGKVIPMKEVFEELEVKSALLKKNGNAKSS